MNSWVRVVPGGKYHFFQKRLWGLSFWHPVCHLHWPLDDDDFADARSCPRMRDRCKKCEAWRKPARKEKKPCDS